MKNAFLNEDLEKEVYINIPPEFESETMINKVCKLRRSFYGLKQSLRAWFHKFTSVLKEDGYTQCQSDRTLFIKHSKEGKFIVHCLCWWYCPDRRQWERSDSYQSLLSKEFDMKDMGHLKYFLGMEVARLSLAISVSQRRYVLDLLKETCMPGCQPIETPMDPNVKELSSTWQWKISTTSWQTNLFVTHTTKY